MIDCYGIALASVCTLMVNNYNVWYIPRPGHNIGALPVRNYPNHLHSVYIMISKEFPYSIFVVGGEGGGEGLRLQ